MAELVDEKPNYKTDLAAYRRWWYRNNTEKAKGYVNKAKATERSIKWRKDNKDRVSSIDKNFYATHKTEAKLRNAQYRKDHPDYFSTAARKRRGNLAVAIPIWCETEKIAHLYRMRDVLNERLSLSGDDALAVDHIIPINSDTVCGLHCWHNLQLLSKSANSSKNNNYEQNW